MLLSVLKPEHQNLEKIDSKVKDEERGDSYNGFCWSSFFCRLEGEVWESNECDIMHCSPNILLFGTFTILFISTYESEIQL